MSVDTQLVATGIEHHRAGRFAEAQELYRQALSAEPASVNVLNLLGAVCINLKQLPEAAQYLSQALQLNPKFAALHDNWGVLMMSENRYVEAIASFRQAIALEGANAQTHLNLANALQRNGQLLEALESYRQVVVLAPASSGSRAEFARLLFGVGRAEEALPHFREVTRLTPNDPKAHFLYADALAQTGRKAESIASYLEALRLNPQSAEACVNLAYLYIETGGYAEAERWSRKAVEMRPNFAEAHHNLGAALSKLERYEEAIEVLKRALSLKPQMPEAHNNIGIALAEKGKFDEAIDEYERSLAMNSENPDALYNLGNAYMKLDQLDRALDHYNRAIALRPAYAEARHNRSAVWLLKGNFFDGLPEYEWRMRSRDYPPLRLVWKLWNGEPLAGRTIVLVAEQGLGDTLQFIRYAPQFKQMGARVLLASLPKLHPILARTAGIDGWVTAEAPCSDADFCLPLLSAPGRMRTLEETIPRNIPYLFTDPDLVAKWQQRLAEIDGFKVGIVWQGNIECPGDHTRSFRLAQFAPLAALEGVRLISLQNGPGTEQIAEFKQQWNVIELEGDIDKTTGAFMDTAAIMQNLDLVVTSDTSAAHLAGGVGARTWVVLQKVPDWRWMVDRADCPWYPTMRLFRQHRLGDWSAPFQEIAAEVAKLSAQPR